MRSKEQKIRTNDQADRMPGYQASHPAAHKWKTIMQQHVIRRIALGVVVATGVTVAILGTGVAQQTSQTDALGTCARYSGLPAGDDDTAGMTFIAGGTFAMGSDQHQPEERFTHIARVDGFWIDRHEVTNAQFKKFVDATGYVTLAERPVDPKIHSDWPQEMLVPGSVVFVTPKDAKGEDGRWWQYVAGANWGQPRGRGSSMGGMENHPAAH